MRRTDRDDQQRYLKEISKEIVLGAPNQAARLGNLLDMHLARRGLCIVTIEERNAIPHPTWDGGQKPLDT